MRKISSHVLRAALVGFLVFLGCMVELYLGYRAGIREATSRLAPIVEANKQEIKGMGIEIYALNNRIDELNAHAILQGDEIGIGSIYHKWYQGRKTSSGKPFDQAAMTAAHRTLPFGTRVRVYCFATGKSVIVTITDRGPYISGRIIDLSEAAARAIGLDALGIAAVSVREVK
jgi:rare lipoprotein A